MREGNSARQTGISSNRAEFSFWIDGSIRNNIETAIQELSRLHVTAALVASERLGHVRITGLNHPAAQFPRMAGTMASQGLTRVYPSREPRSFSRS